MTATLAIWLLGGLFLASLLAVVLQGEFRSVHPWVRFAEEHGLSHHSDETTRRVEGVWEGRRFVLRLRSYDGDRREMFLEVPVEGLELPASHIRRAPEGADSGPSESEVDRLDVDDPIGDGRLSLEMRDAAEGGEFRVDGALERLAELQSAEPRIEWRDGRLVYAARGVMRERRRLAELVGRMVESARHVEGG